MRYALAAAVLAAFGTGRAEAALLTYVGAGVNGQNGQAFEVSLVYDNQLVTGTPDPVTGFQTLVQPAGVLFLRGGGFGPISAAPPRLTLEPAGGGLFTLVAADQSTPGFLTLRLAGFAGPQFPAALTLGPGSTLTARGGAVTGAVTTLAAAPEPGTLAGAGVAALAAVGWALRRRAA